MLRVCMLRVSRLRVGVRKRVGLRVWVRVGAVRREGHAPWGLHVERRCAGMLPLLGVGTSPDIAVVPNFHRAIAAGVSVHLSADVAHAEWARRPVDDLNHAPHVGGGAHHTSGAAALPRFRDTCRGTHSTAQSHHRTSTARHNHITAQAQHVQPNAAVERRKWQELQRPARPDECSIQK